MGKVYKQVFCNNYNMAMTLELPKKLDKEIQEVVESGRFASKSEFIRAALREKLSGSGTQ